MPNIPPDLQKRIENECNVFSLEVSPVGGGCISSSVLAETEKGTFFVKWDSNDRRDMIEAEVHGLMLLGEAGEVRVPEVYAWGEESGSAYLVTEAIEGERQGDEQLGSELAALHSHSAEQFGLEWDNFIGSLPQSNTPHESWPEFFIDERLRPQVKQARDEGSLSAEDEKTFERLYERLEHFFPEEAPALLHGDLWAGNVLGDEAGNPVLIDPAVYYGHREIELAFTNLFGGFSEAFYRAYTEEFPLADGFEERIPVYNLYPLLVHLNLFGRTYYAPLQRTLERYV
jgi:fructosamine-3-kinase